MILVLPCAVWPAVPSGKVVTYREPGLLVCHERIDTDLVTDKLIVNGTHMIDLVFAALYRYAIDQVQGECNHNDPDDKDKPDYFRKSLFPAGPRSTTSHVQIIRLWLGL